MVDKPALTIITPVSIDHQQYLGETLPEIAGEKAGIIKRGVPVIVGPQELAALEVIEARAARLGAPVLAYGQHWHVWEEAGRLVFQDENGLLDLPLPNLPGPFQVQNAGAAIAALRALGKGEAACEAAVTRAYWPARMQRLRVGPLVESGARGRVVAGRRAQSGGRGGGGGDAGADARARDASDLRHAEHQGRARLYGAAGALCHAAACRVDPGREEHAARRGDRRGRAAAGMEAVTAGSVAEALAAIAAASPQARVLICGSLYLAGGVLRENG